MKISAILALFFLLITISTGVLAKSKKRRSNRCKKLCERTFIAYRESGKTINEFGDVCDKNYAEKAKDRNCPKDLCDTIKSLAKKTQDMAKKKRKREVSTMCRLYSNKKKSG